MREVICRLVKWTHQVADQIIDHLRVDTPEHIYHISLN